MFCTDRDRSPCGAHRRRKDVTASMPTVAVFRETFLRPSETFVRDHLLNLPTWTAEAVTTGLRADRLDVPGVPVHLAQWTGPRGRLVWRSARLAGRPSGAVLAGALRRTVQRLDPDVVHAHFGPDTAFADLALRRTRYPLIGTFHGFDATVRPEVVAEWGWSARRLVEQGPALLNRLAAIITVSGPLRDRLVQRGAPPERVHVIPCGVRPDEFTWSPPPPDGPVLFVGRLVQKKGLADLLDAMAGMADPPRLVVIGEGPDGPDLRARATRLRLDVEFRGSATSTQVRDAMREASVVAMPSQTAANGDMEGMPVVSVEAGASGRPVVGYAHSGLVESVVDGRTGLLAPERDIAGLRDRLAAVLSDPEQALSFGRAARAHIVANFTLADTLTRLENVYEEVLARRRRS